MPIFIKNFKMGIAIKYSFTNIKYFPKNYNFINTIKNDEFSTSSPSYSFVENLYLKRILKEEENLKKRENIYRRKLLNELFDECQLNISGASYLGVDKQFLLAVDIDVLKKVGFLKDNTNVMDQLLSHLEPFPYEKQKFQDRRNISIDNIKTSIEKQYLAWKFDVDYKLINLLYHRFHMCVLKSKSLKSLKRNLDAINQVPQTRAQSIGNKIYLLNVAPFDDKTLLNFKSSIVGVGWDEAVKFYPELMKRSYGRILLVNKILQSKNFTVNQIRKALPVLPTKLILMLKRLIYMLNCGQLVEHRKEVDFLKLLSLQQKELADLIENKGKTFRELLQIIENYEIMKSNSGKFSTQEYWYLLQKNLKTTDETLKTLTRHPKLCMVPETRISDTVKFLKQMKFSDEEINESISIVLYPRSFIKKALRKIDEERHHLEAIGFVNGCVPEETHLFEKGTKLKRKTLQLCLYYIEKDFNFSGDGVFLSDN